MSNQRDRDTDAERLLERTCSRRRSRARSRRPADAEEIRRAVYAEWDAVTGRRVWLKTRRVCRGGLGAAGRRGLGRSRLGAERAAARRRARRARPRRRRHRWRGRLAVGSDARGWATRCRRARARWRFGLASGGSLRVGTGQRDRVDERRRRRARRRRALFRLRGSTRRRNSASRRSSVPCATWARSSSCDSTARSRLDVGVRDGRVVLTNDGDSGHGRGWRAARRHAGLEHHSPRHDGHLRQRVGLGRKAGAAVRHRWPHGQRLPRVVCAIRRAAASSSVARPPRAWRARPCLHGSIDLEPLQKLSAVLALTDLTYSLEGERVVINTR